MLSAIVEVLWTARYDYEPGWALSPHEHDFFQIIYCLGGRGTLTLDGEPHQLAPGTLFLIRPARPHGLVAASAVKTLDVKFQVRAASLRKPLLAMPCVWRRACRSPLALCSASARRSASTRRFASTRRSAIARRASFRDRRRPHAPLRHGILHGTQYDRTARFDNAGNPAGGDGQVTSAAPGRVLDSGVRRTL